MFRTSNRLRDLFRRRPHPHDRVHGAKQRGRTAHALRLVFTGVVDEQYGADTLRLYEMATGPLDASRPWETRDVVGMYRFLQRLWRNMVDEETAELAAEDVRESVGGTFLEDAPVLRVSSAIHCR